MEMCNGCGRTNFLKRVLEKLSRFAIIFTSYVTRKSVIILIKSVLTMNNWP